MSTMGFSIAGLDHVVINVANLTESAAWYQRVLGVASAPVPPAGRATFVCGSQAIRLRPVAASQQEWGTAVRPTPGSQDLCFCSEASVPEIVAHLMRLDVAIESGPVAKVGARGPMLSVYCRDPDGNLIEIATYRRP